MRRPDVFTLDYSHPLAQGLVFAGLGALSGAEKYTDSSLVSAQGSVLLYSDKNWQISQELKRRVFSGQGQTNNNRVEVPHRPEFELVKFSGKTFSAWVRFREDPPSLPRYGVFFGAPGAVALGIFKDQFTFAISDSSGVARNALNFSRTLQVGEWFHVAGVYRSSNTQTLYINGQAVISGGWSSWASPGTGRPVCIRAGHNLSEIDSVVPGDVADPIIHNRSLSPAEIAFLADRTDPMLGGLVREVNPVAYFDLGASGPRLQGNQINNSIVWSWT